MYQQSSTLLEENNIVCSSDISVGDIHYDLASLNSLHETEDLHYWSCIRRYLIEMIVKRHVNRSDFTMLDMGCGNGNVMAGIGKKFPYAVLTGWDCYPEALLHCRQRTKSATLELHDVCTLPLLPKEQFDVITILDVLEHLDHPEKVIESIHSLLKKDGIVIATVPALKALWSDRDVFNGHRKRYEHDEFLALFDRTHFEIVHSNYLFFYLVFPAFLHRKILSFFTKTNGQKIEQIELKTIPFLNVILKLWGYLEVWWSLIFPLPCGTSIYCVLKKK